MKITCRFCATAALVLATAFPLRAQRTWDPGLTPTTPSGGTGTWDSATANWSNGTTDVAWTGGVATFRQPPTGTLSTITVSGTQAVTGLTFSPTNGGPSIPFTFTFQGSPINISGTTVLNMSSNTSSVVVRLESGLTGTGNLVLTNGDNNVLFSRQVVLGTSNFTGNVTMNEGTRLSVAADSDLGVGPLLINYSGNPSATKNVVLTFSAAFNSARNIVLSNGVALNNSWGTGASSYSGAISGTGSVSLSLSTSGVTFSGHSTYSGNTSLFGKLILGADNVLPDTRLSINSSGTVLDLNGNSETLGALSFGVSSGMSTFDFATGVSSLAFADSSALTWSGSGLLNVVNFTAGVDSLRFGTTAGGLTTAQLNRLRFDGTGLAQIDASGFVTAVSAIPEPSTYAALAGLGVLGVAIWRRGATEKRHHRATGL